MRAVLIRAVATVALAAAVASAGATDPCEQYKSCQTCVSHSLCGWCSEPVIYPGNVTGGQCAGFNPDGPNPFACNGIFSTEQCFAGYVCDEVDFECKLGQPGSGNTLQKCEENCTNHGQIYLCNHTSKKCYEVPRGTPGGTSLAVCDASCAHPSPHPAPPPSPHPTTLLYACNTSSGTCDPAPAGKGESKSVCEQECTKVNNTEYMCNSFLKKCVKLPKGIPGGETLKKCEATCTPHPKPGPPPALLGGFFRGIQIQTGYKTGTFNMQVNESVVTIVELQKGRVTKRETGTPSHVEGDAIVMYITLTSGPDSGKVIKTLTVFGTPGPETKYAAIALSSPGGDAPTGIKAAMTAPGQQVMAVAECLTPECKFTLPVQSSIRKHRRMHRQASPSDRCAAFDASCSDCVSHEYCGWCSVNVTYKDGSKGTQCAGFNSPNGSSPAFVCNGRYSTFNCTQGYECDHKTLQCKATTPGNGMPLAECKQFCHATPPPTPPQHMALCNLTTHQCHPCPNNASNCPGALPKDACEAACTHHKKGPHANIIGRWRGIYIQNGYKRVESELVFDNVTAHFYISNVLQFSANVTSLGADVMIFDIISGSKKGFKFSALYQLAPQVEGIYETMTMAAGALAGSTPSTYAAAMSTEGDHVYALNKCMGEPCKFRDE